MSHQNQRLVSALRAGIANVLHGLPLCCFSGKQHLNVPAKSGHLFLQSCSSKPDRDTCYFKIRISDESKRLRIELRRQVAREFKQRGLRNRYQRRITANHVVLPSNLLDKSSSDMVWRGKIG